jgi:hypothetical protein
MTRGRSRPDGSQAPNHDTERHERSMEGPDRATHQMTDAEQRLQVRVVLGLYLFAAVLIGGGLLIDGCFR